MRNDLIISPYNKGSTDFLFFFLVESLIPNLEKFKNKDNQEFNILFFCDNEEKLDSTYSQLCDFIKSNYSGIYNIFDKETVGLNKISFQRIKSTIYSNTFFSVDVYFIYLDYKNRIKINQTIKEFNKTNIISIFHDFKYNEKNEIVLNYCIKNSLYNLATHIIRDNYLSIYDYLSESNNMMIKFINKGFAVSFYSDIITIDEGTLQETMIL